MIRGENGRPIVPLNLWMNREQIEATIAALDEHRDRVDMIDDSEEATAYGILLSDLIEAFENVRQRYDDDQEEERARAAAALAAGIPAAGLPGHQEEAPAPRGWSHAEPGPDDLEPIDQEGAP